MKISFIVCYSSTKPMTVFDSKSWPVRDSNLDQIVSQSTNKLIKQILEIPVEKEVLLMDNSGDFITDIIDKDLTVIKTHGSWTDSEFKENLHLFENIKDRIVTTFKSNDQAQTTALAYNHGINIATGDYIILQHNDTQYLFNEYPKDKVLPDAIKLLEDNNYEYLSIDKKPSKETSPKGIDYFADCYWFLCRGDFYKKHNCWVDWGRGDNNHLATIRCYEKKLPYLHLPGFYEGHYKPEGEEFKKQIKLKYPQFNNTSRNIHTLNDIPFLIHCKGGTGLKNFIKRK